MNRRIQLCALYPRRRFRRGPKQACWSMKLRRTGIWHRSPTGWRPGARPDCWPDARGCIRASRGCLQLACRDTAPCAALRPSARSLGNNPSPWSSARRPRHRAPLLQPHKPEQKLSREWAAGALKRAKCWRAVLRACSQEPMVVLDTGGAVEERGRGPASRSPIRWARCSSRLLDDGLESTVLIMGGGLSFLGLMRQLVNGSCLCAKSRRAWLLSQFTYGGRQWNLVSKSGGMEQRHCFMTCKTFWNDGKGNPARGALEHAAFRTGKKEKIKCVSPGKDGAISAYLNKSRLSTGKTLCLCQRSGLLMTAVSLWKPPRVFAVQASGAGGKS